MALKDNNRFRKVVYGIGEGGRGGGGWGKSDYKDCFRSQKLAETCKTKPEYFVD